jgi:hypothetical protein
VLNLPPFYLSYAHAGPESNRAAELFYRQLRGDLQPLVSVPVGTGMGFFDAEGLTAAERWRHELAAALGTCQVLVALLSVPYFNSEWCGKEWHAFTAREQEELPGRARPQFQGPIIPVRWAPIPFSLPAVVGNEVQIFRPKRTKAQPDLPERYDEEGLFGLLRMGDEDAFKDVVWDLAKCIQQVYYSQLLKPREFDPDQLRNAFEDDVLCPGLKRLLRRTSSSVTRVPIRSAATRETIPTSWWRSSTLISPMQFSISPPAATLTDSSIARFLSARIGRSSLRGR